MEKIEDLNFMPLATDMGVNGPFNCYPTKFQRSLKSQDAKSTECQSTKCQIHECHPNVPEIMSPSRGGGGFSPRPHFSSRKGQHPASLTL